MINLLTALHKKDAPTALGVVREATALHLEMKLFLRLLLESVRAVMVIRNDAASADIILASFSSELAQALRGFASEATSPLNSHLLLKLLAALDNGSRSPLPYLPLEVAVVEHCGGQ